MTSQKWEKGMLESSKERVKLLKAGISGKRIETMYIKFNNLKIVHQPVLFELGETDSKNIENYNNQKL
jgi:hypothetical protein